MSELSNFSSLRYRLFTSVWLIIFTLLLLSGCGEGPVNTPKTDTQTEALVSSMITDVDTSDTVLDSEISEDAYGRSIAHTKLMIAFNADATAGEASALLDSINATITSSIEGGRSVVVRIPDPGNLDAYDAIVANIEAEAFVDFVMKGEMPGTLALPGNYYIPPVVNELPYIDHHLAVRAHAAWNAKKAIQTTPQVLIVDKFGNGAPTHSSINYTGTSGDFDNNSSPDVHGYHVLGIIAGVFGSHYTTGIFPDTISLRAVDVSAGIDWATTQNKMLAILRATPGKWVVNTSIGYEPCTGTGRNCILRDVARQRAELWVEDVRRLGLENRVLHVSAAGNIKTPPGNQIRDAETASIFASARLLPGLTDVLGDPLSNLSNTLVIENVTNTVVDPANIQPVMIKCLNVDSFVGGDLAAIGEEVWSFIDSASDQYNLSGTSMAAPEVAGLAAYLWSIDSAPDAQQILTAIYTNAQAVPVLSGDTTCSDWPNPAPVIDAYASLLSLDATAAPTPANSPVRFAILDINDDGDFDETDLALFIDTYFDTSTQPPTLIESSEPDYGRYDLNGDGWTGGDTTHAFDLDRTGSIQYGSPVLGSAEQNIESNTIRFDENSLTDMKVLCYYAYSPLYTGDTDARTDIMTPYLDQCGDKKKIAFTSARDGNIEVYIMDADGSNQTRLTDNSLDEWYPVWSHNGTRIAFTSTVPLSFYHDIYTINADGTGYKNLTFYNNNPDYSSAEPAWSPDGSKIAFTAYNNFDTEIYVMDEGGNNRIKLTDNPRKYNKSPTWSPDGTKIAFSSTRDYDTDGLRSEIYVMNSDGSNQTRLTNMGVYNASPAWSPDGTKIAFVSTHDYYYSSIYVMNADGSNLTQLASSGEFVWSPDSSKIAFTSDAIPTAIYVMNADGSNQLNLTNNQDDSHPSWSADGTKIAFTCYRPASAICVMNADGSNQRILTNPSVPPESNRNPAWQP